MQDGVDARPVALGDGFKPEAYARASIPVYLIGDREHGEAKVLWRPENGEYRSVAAYSSGDTLKLPGDVAVEIPVDLLRQS